MRGDNDASRSALLADAAGLLAAVIVFLAVGFAGLGLTRAAVGADAFKQVFRLVILPVCGFIAGFVSLLIIKKAKVCLIAALVTNAVVFLIVNGFTFSVLLWNLLYIFSSVIGIFIAYIVLTHK